MKFCPKCGLEKEASAFGKTRKPIYAGWCRNCSTCDSRSMAQKKYDACRPKRMNRKSNWAKLNSEKHNDNCRKWAAKNPEKVRQMQLRWRSNNKEKYLATRRSWYKRTYPTKREALRLKVRLAYAANPQKYILLSRANYYFDKEKWKERNSTRYYQKQYGPLLWILAKETIKLGRIIADVRKEKSV